MKNFYSDILVTFDARTAIESGRTGYYDYSDNKAALRNFTADLGRRILLKYPQAKFYIESLFRDRAANTAAGGAEDSQHLYFLASDIYYQGLTQAQFIAELKTTPGIRYYTYADGHIHYDLKNVELSNWKYDSGNQPFFFNSLLESLNQLPTLLPDYSQETLSTSAEMLPAAEEKRSAATGIIIIILLILAFKKK